jgi:WD40 repeat protein
MTRRDAAATIAACFVTLLPVVTVAQERPVRRITIPALVTAVAFAPDGETLLAWDPAGWSRWDAVSGRQRGREIVIAKACERVSAFPRTEDGRVIAVQCRDRIVFFDVATARALGERPLPENQTAAIYTASADGQVTAIVKAGATDTVTVGTMSGSAAGTDLPIGAEVGQLKLSASGTRLTVGTVRGVQVRELPEGTLLRTIEGRASHALSADATRLAVLSEKGVRLLDPASGDVIREMDGRVSHLRFSDDGRWLVGWTNQRVILWDVGSGAQRLVLTSDEFVAASVSADGQRLATVSLERRGEGTSSIVAIWRIPSSSPAIK